MKYYWMITFLAAILALASSATAQKQSAGGQYYTLDLQLVRDDVVVATPKVTVQPGKPAVMAVPESDGYAIKAQALPRAGETEGRVELTLEVYFPGRGNWILVASPTMTMNVGESASYGIPKDTSGKSLQINAKVTRRVADMSEMRGECPLAKPANWNALMSAPVSDYKMLAVQFSVPSPA